KPVTGVGGVVEFDLNAVSVDVGAFPIDEILDFRKEHLAEHRAYCLAARSSAYALSRMNAEERKHEFTKRQAELDGIAAQLRQHARKAWKKPAAFALSFTGAVVSAAHGNLLGAALSIGSGLLAYQGAKPPDAGAYSYLFRAHERFGY